jgi:hypothetical protein
MGQAAQFGAPLGEYRGGFARIMYGIGALIMFVLAAVIIAAGATSSDIGGTIALILVGVLFVAAGVYLVYRVLAALGTRIQLFEGGFSVTQRGKTTTGAWNDVSQITQQIIRQTYYGIPIWTSFTYKLQLNNGEKLRFTETIGKVREMGETMQRQITQALTPRALQALQSGASLPFGKLSVNPMGISNGNETLPWNQISNVQAVSGAIVISKAGKKLRWASASIARTPNAYVLLSLIDIMRRSGGQLPR